MQVLRKLALEAEDNYYSLEEVYKGRPTKFYEFIHHSDCEGGYISYMFFDIKPKKRNYLCGNLDELKLEMVLLGKLLGIDEDTPYDPNNHTINAMVEFISDVVNADNVLEYH